MLERVELRPRDPLLPYHFYGLSRFFCRSHGNKVDHLSLQITTLLLPLANLKLTTYLGILERIFFLKEKKKKFDA